MNLNVLRRSTNLAKIFFATKKIYELATTKKTYEFATIKKTYELATTKKIYELATTKKTYKLVTTKKTYELATTKIYQLRCFCHNAHCFDSSYSFKLHSKFYSLLIDFWRSLLLECLCSLTYRTRFRSSFLVRNSLNCFNCF